MKSFGPHLGRAILSLLHGELTRALPLDAALPHTAGELQPHLARRSHQLTLPPSCRLHPHLASGCLPWPIKGSRLPPVALSPHTHHRALILILLLLRTPGASSPCYYALTMPRKRRSSSAEADARFTRAEAEGYVPGAYREEDNVKDLSKHNDKT